MFSFQYRWIAYGAPLYLYLGFIISTFIISSVKEIRDPNSVNVNNANANPFRNPNLDGNALQHIQSAPPPVPFPVPVPIPNNSFDRNIGENQFAGIDWDANSNSANVENSSDNVNANHIVNPDSNIGENGIGELRNREPPPVTGISAPIQSRLNQSIVQ